MGIRMREREEQKDTRAVPGRVGSEGCCPLAGATRDDGAGEPASADMVRRVSNTFTEENSSREINIHKSGVYSRNGNTWQGRLRRLLPARGGHRGGRSTRTKGCGHCE